ncbi:MAG TPA: hypothetical protein PLG67_00265 [Bacillota bacterium]|jgi:hypothetical protein|nr:hypothetical protein [Bacillota bacterium]HQE67317.1 hypothetical protein [Bacillota bacterium]HQI16968.1 hypothetical protein [Bacillota bacterium]HQJ37481.1 hypothetical protein [Bacillota bacterium]HQL35006.1 hypothetical protein [Bacillota bacterium]
MNIIDETYNGEKYPIIERKYNSYWFPENYNPDNEEAQAEELVNSYMNHEDIINNKNKNSK